jgi:hypothetical protein
MLSTAESLQRDMRAEFHRSRHIDQDVNLLGAAQKERILCRGMAAIPNCVFQLAEGRHCGRQCARVVERRLCLFDMAIRDRHQAHAGHGVQDLVGNSARHESSANHADPDRTST